MTFVGRRSIAADTALSCAIITLPFWVPSIFSKATSIPAVSTTAIATGQLFLRASAPPAAIALRACSSVTLVPYWGTWANATAAVNAAMPPPRAAHWAIFMSSSVDLFGLDCDKHLRIREHLRAQNTPRDAPALIWGACRLNDE